MNLQSILQKSKKRSLQKQNKKKNEPVEKKSKSYEEYSLKSNGKYRYLSRIENTIVQLNVNESEEQKVKKFLEKCFKREMRNKKMSNICLTFFVCMLLLYRKKNKIKER